MFFFTFFNQNVVVYFNKTLVNFFQYLLTAVFILNIPAHTPVFSQNPKLDSLRSALGQRTDKDTSYINDLIYLASQTRNESIEKAKEIYNEARALSSQLSQTKFEIKSLTGLGICNAMMNQYSEAISYFNNALRLSLEIGNVEYAADSYNNLGIVYKSLGDYPSSLNYYSKSKSIYDSLKFETGIAGTYDNMGVLYDLMKEPEKALEYYQKSLAYYKEKNLEYKTATTSSNIAILLVNKGEFLQAIEIYENSLKYYVDNNINTNAARQRANLGFAYYKNKTYEKAEFHLLTAYNEAEKLHMNETRINTLYSLSKLKADLNLFTKSLEFAEKAKSIADSLQSFNLKAKTQELLSYVFQKSGNAEKALEHYILYKAFEDSLFNEEKLKAYKAQQVLMEVNEKDRLLEQQSFDMAFLNSQSVLDIRWKWALSFASLFFLIAGLLYFQKSRIAKSYARQLEAKNFYITDQKEEIEIINEQLEREIRFRKETDETINYFATSLFDKNEEEEILWDVAKNCISRLGLVDCVIYLFDEPRGVLIQKAAYGTKNPEDFEIHEPLEIPLGKGIVGTVALTGVAEIVNDSSKDPRYIVDDEARLSELAVPLKFQHKVIGVIDSEHPEKGFFNQYHLDALNTIAAICSSKIAQAKADVEAKKAKQAKQEADQIKQMDQLKSQFFANVSHEFRTPLNLILAPLHKKRYPIPVWEMEMMGRNAKRLLRLVNQLLDLAKIEVGLVKLENRHINVAKFVSEIAHSFTPLAEAKQIIFLVDIPERDYVAFLDPDKLEKIIYNLLSNAFKFTPSGGWVSIKLFMEKEDTISLTVTDTGIGIPEALKEKIFHRFYQIDSSQTRQYEGTGIGLSLTKELVDLMEGSIVLESKGQNGCAFSVHLPTGVAPGEHVEIYDDFYTSIATAGGYQELTSLPQDESNASTIVSDNLPLVLLVEDNEDLRRYLRTHLFNEFNIIEAENGKEGLSMALERIPDLIVTDIMMPEMNGVTMIKSLRDDDRTSHIPVILLTARDDGETKVKGFETGAEQYLVKPFEINELIARVKSLLARSERLKQKFSQVITLEPEDMVIDNKDAAFLEKIMKIVEDNMANESFTVEHLQKEIAMSRMQLHRKLKALTNQSASDFIRSVRLKRAAQILQEPGMQIAEAAYLSGFNHLSYFSKCFKEQFGVLPSDYSKKTV